MEIQQEGDRFVRTLLAESDPKKQAAMALQWIIDMGKAGHLVVVPPLDAMLGLAMADKTPGLHAKKGG